MASRLIGLLRRFSWTPLFLAFLVVSAPANAASVIRDTEVEALLHNLMAPVFKVAGLDPDDVRIYIVNNQQLNAFVAGGQNIFVNTGLFITAETPEQLQAVLAHETGHIAGGHLARGSQAMDRAGTQMIIGSILGLAAAVVGAPEVGMAMLAGGMTVAQGEFLAFTRTQEQSADQAAVTFLGRLHLPPDGLLQFFQILNTQNNLLGGERGNPFLRSHPLTQERIDFLRTQVARSPYEGRQLPSSDHVAFDRSRAKLDAYLSPPNQTLKKYAGNSLVDRYAQAIAYYKIPDVKKSLSLIDELIKENPSDPYFPEFKGQMLFENGHVAESVQPFRDALRLKVDAPLIRYALARALLEEQGGNNAPEAAALLRDVTRVDPRNASAWRSLGVAEGQIGNRGESAMALAEYALLIRNYDDARLYVSRAKAAVPPESASYYRVEDLERAVNDLRDDLRRNR
ncbi:Putative Zn-dependent protease, contains TPR repeats [Arboricoccus pini]|uniref:Putative Zn-dependent protease, contains TPR repeats n=1 Tax=Arboricoccus pini TaxID=1963835 RepID=A0A212R5S7_9PROT|nr:M48 family metalloprotease [Arboricoccus pini]SNB67261.1 Putative Zn-dependent protease, contains TPR repeats [Arboricoccus pini]